MSTIFKWIIGFWFLWYIGGLLLTDEGSPSLWDSKAKTATFVMTTVFGLTAAVIQLNNERENDDTTPPSK